MNQDLLIKIAYLIASVMFIIGIKMLGKVSTAHRGNAWSAVAMLIAILITLLDKEILSFTEIFVTILAGSLIGAIVAQKARMTQMPEMVAILNGFGGAASVLVALFEYWRHVHMGTAISLDAVVMISILLSVLIGAVTFTGSMVALNARFSMESVMLTDLRIGLRTTCIGIRKSYTYRLVSPLLF